MASTGLKLVVCGTGRCGTGYIARVLSEAGVKAGHEEVFTPNGPIERNMSTYEADSSWLAMPHLPSIRAGGVTVAGVYRHPQAVVSSLLGIEFFEHDSPYLRYAYRHVPGLIDKGSPFEKACAFYAFWNMKIVREAHYLFNIDYPAFDLLARSAGVPVSDIAAAIPAVSQTYNHRQRSDVAGRDFPGYVWEAWQLLEDASRAS